MLATEHNSVWIAESGHDWLSSNPHQGRPRQHKGPHLQTESFQTSTRGVLPAW